MKVYYFKLFFLGCVCILDDKIYFFCCCDNEVKDKMRGKYLDVFKKFFLRRFCNRYVDFCKKENVDV